MVVEQCIIVLLGKNTALHKTECRSHTTVYCLYNMLDRMRLWLTQVTDQIIVAVVTDKRPAAVACAVSSSGIGAGIAHQISISLGEQRGGKDPCQGQSGR